MDSGDVLPLLGSQLLLVIPSLLGWTAALVTAIVLMRRGAGGSSMLLLFGAAIMVLSTLLRVPLAALVPLLAARGYTATTAGAWLSASAMALELLKLAGIACLVSAFWFHFRAVKVAAKAS